MREILNVRMLSVRAGWLFVLGASLVLPVAAQSQNSEPKTSTSSAAVPKEANEAAEKPGVATTGKKPGGLTEGLTVHGHWVIDVRNPDGTLAAHRDFENAYQGGNLLAILMARQSSTGLWAVFLNGSNSQPILTEPTEPFNFGGKVVSKNLTVSVVAGLVLSGSYTAPFTDTIGTAETAQATCSATVAPATPCETGSYFEFTEANFSPINVVQGQIVQVTVTITFS